MNLGLFFEILLRHNTRAQYEPNMKASFFFYFVRIKKISFLIKFS
jgi:hypothetical protein